MFLKLPLLPVNKLFQWSTILRKLFLLCSPVHLGFINFILWPLALIFWVIPNLLGFGSVRSIFL